MERRWKVSEMTRPHWPDEVRLKMIEKSEFYSEPQVYQYGFYDGFQCAQIQTQGLKEQNRELVDVVERCKDVIYAYNDYRPTATGNEILQAIQERLTKYNNLNQM